MTKHLWEIDHPYYAPEGEYTRFKSWDDFFEGWKNSDDDMNVLFRWDWEGKMYNDEQEKVPIEPKDDNYRAYTLTIVYVLQRKSKFITCAIDVCRADEPAVLEFLKKKFEYLKVMWEGIS